MHSLLHHNRQHHNKKQQATPVIEEVVDVLPATCRRPISISKLNLPNPMAKTRVFSNPGTGVQTGVYHVVSRFVDRRKVFGNEEREVFRAMMGGTTGHTSNFPRRPQFPISIS